MKRVLALFIALVCAFATPALAKDIHPPLYVVRDADSTMYLFGTIHTRPHGAAWGGPEAENALAQSQSVWTELEFSNAADEQAAGLVAQRGISQSETLSSWMSPEDIAELRARTASMSVPFAYIDSMRPWLVTLTLSTLAMSQDYDAQAGADRMLSRAAQARGLHSRWLETPEQQVAVLSSMSEEAQRQMLLGALAQSPDDTAEEFDLLSRAWERGDRRKLQRFVIDDLREMAPDLYDVVFRARNAVWVETLDQRLHGEGVDFVAVGAGHLLGPDGLVAQLRARGYSVERVRRERSAPAPS